jgi:hypothetical protein
VPTILGMASRTGYGKQLGTGIATSMKRANCKSLSVNHLRARGPRKSLMFNSLRLVFTARFSLHSQQKQEKDQALLTQTQSER